MKASVGVNVSVHVRVWLWIEREEVERAMVLSIGDAVLDTRVLGKRDDERKCYGKFFHVGRCHGTFAFTIALSEREFAHASPRTGGGIQCRLPHQMMASSCSAKLDSVQSSSRLSIRVQWPCIYSGY